MGETTIILEVKVTNEADYKDVHIRDNFGHSCNYGDDTNSESVGECVVDFLKDYHEME